MGPFRLSARTSRCPRESSPTCDTHLKKAPKMGLFLNGAAGENRTHDPVLTKDVRYHYATAALVGGYFNAFLKKVKYKIRKKEKMSIILKK